MERWLVKLTNFKQVELSADEIKFQNGFICTRHGNVWRQIYPLHKVLGAPKIIKDKKGKK